MVQITTFAYPILSCVDLGCDNYLNKYDQSITHRDILDPPMFLTQIPEQLHPGWKTVENYEGGPCLFMSAGNLRRFTHSHIEH